MMCDGNICVAFAPTSQLLTFLPVVQSWKMTQPKYTQDEMDRDE